MPSTVIDRVEYDPENRILSVVFQSGRVYYYKEVPQGIYLTLRAARSKGRYLNNYIKGVYEFESSNT
ncbi:KTSC domain-containing protein [Pedobacter frigoris]|uniref:KTSC domain-containing protein n=1 Tax=Pedobacter frigoris TaxID=2571272 RepID=A0A4U1CUE2_9SPHI|nr:KTSC domain-containing protein [Pedobacter frigoris]TKC09629.1 KTSC domain-containing protein [Pedobacter frigoris]